MWERTVFGEGVECRGEDVHAQRLQALLLELRKTDHDRARVGAELDVGGPVEAETAVVGTQAAVVFAAFAPHLELVECDHGIPAEELAVEEDDG